MNWLNDEFIDDPSADAGPFVCNGPIGVMFVIAVSFVLAFVLVALIGGSLL